MGNDIERVAMDIRRGAGFGDEHTVHVGQVVRHWMGVDVLMVEPGQLQLGTLLRTAGRWQIAVVETAMDPRFVASHELGHWVFRHLHGMTFASLDDEERAANVFAAVLLAPAKLVTRAHAHYGENVRGIASGVRISQTSTVLRLGEVRGEDRGVVTPGGRTLLRGTTLTRESAIAAARGKVPGLARTRLRGGIDEGRVAVRVVG